MARMIIEFDEERMEKDGLDVSAAWEQVGTLKDYTNEGEDIIIETGKGCFEGDFGLMVFFEDLFEEVEWIMKYVKKWLMDWDSSGEYDNLIEDIRETGRKCCYE